MTIKTQIVYRVEGDNFSSSFGADENLTLAELAVILKSQGIELANTEPGYEQKTTNARDVRARFMAGTIAGKTPGEIYNLVQGRIDGWTSLAQAKADLREWLPLMAAAIAWLVIDQD